MPMITIGETELFYEISGNETGPWVTLSHSHATDIALWRHQVEALAADYHVLAYEVRGHGKSPATPPPYTIEMLSDDVIALWDGLGITRSHFIGLSLGGTTGLGIAIRYPERLVKLIACDCHGQAHPPFKAAWEPRIELAQNSGMAALVASTLDRWFEPDVQAREPGLMAEVTRMITETSVDGYVGAARALQGINYGDRLTHITVPTLYIAGAQDKGAAAAGVKQMHEATPGSQFVEIDPAGHLSCLENPAAFNRAVLDFLSS
jgi:3-oxoadipate enol-lactonase